MVPVTAGGPLNTPARKKPPRINLEIAWGQTVRVGASSSSLSMAR